MVIRDIQGTVTCPDCGSENVKFKWSFTTIVTCVGKLLGVPTVKIFEKRCAECGHEFQVFRKQPLDTVQSRTCDAIVIIIYAPVADFIHYVDSFPPKSPVNVGVSHGCSDEGCPPPTAPQPSSWSRYNSPLKYSLQVRQFTVCCLFAHPSVDFKFKSQKILAFSI